MLMLQLTDENAIKQLHPSLRLPPLGLDAF